MTTFLIPVVKKKAGSVNSRPVAIPVTKGDGQELSLVRGRHP